MRVKPRILILGGTRDALDLAALLLAKGFDVTTSLAGVTTHPEKPQGALRSGGFGGVEGLVAYARNFDIVVDAAHPFAARISAHASAAAERLGIPCVRLERPPWTAVANDLWINVASNEAALAALAAGARVFLAIGRKDIAPFMARGDLSGILRMIEPPDGLVPEIGRAHV